MSEAIQTSPAALQLLTDADATNGPPVDDASGVALAALYDRKSGIPLNLTLLVASTAGSGTMTVTVRAWGYFDARWYPLGVGTAAAKGVINDGAAIAETAADEIRHAEILYGAGHFERLYPEVTAIGGTATAISVWVIG